MRKNTLFNLAAVSLALVAGGTGQAQSYSNAVMALNPTAYWPLNESTQPPQPINLTAANLGSLGVAGNGFYGAWYQPSGNTWYLTNSIVQSNAVTFPFDGSKAMYCQRAPGQYVVVPRASNGVANPNLTLAPPFTIEAWLQIGTVGGALGTIVSQGGFVNLNTGGPDPANPYHGGLGTGWAGVELGQYQDYLFLICNATNGQSKANELDTSGYNQAKGFHVGDWVHVVATFDGTTEAIYTNGVFSVSKNIGVNGAGVTYVPDPTSPLMIGCGSDVAASYGIAFQGAIHDVAIYNSVLSETSVLNHFETAYGTNATYGSSYPTAVLADTPTLYYRLNDPQTMTNAGYPSGSFPVAANYGSVGAAGAGVYQPGTTPGVAGPPFSGFGAGSKSVAINGFLGAVDVGNSNLPAALNPTGYSPLTVVSWFKAGPADAPGRFQEIVGHSDSSYRLALGQVAGENHFNPGPGPELQFVSPADVVTNNFALNDGKWHMAAGVSDGTNEYLYLDGILAKSATTSGINIVGTTRDLLLGGDGQYTFASASSANTIRNFDGQIAQVAFWTNALSAAQIQQLYGAAAVPPTITQQPQSVTNNAGTAATLTVGARGSQPFTYQWYKNSSQLGGATGSSLVFNPVALGNAGNYFVVVANSSGSATSVVAQLTVYGAPVVVEQSPTTIQVFRGTSPTLYVSAIGPSPSYQWSLNGSPISGATISSYTVANVQSGGTYTCSVSNTFGPTPIAPISLSVLTDPAAAYPQAVLADHPRSYFRLDEASGTTAYDYAGGLNATYTNATLGQPGYSPNEPTELSASFGPGDDSFAGYVPSFLNFGAPAGTAVQFSVEAWLNSYFNLPNSDAGIVAIGYGFGGEQFTLDCGAHAGAYRTVRFYVNDASGANHGVNSTNASVLADGNWHHVVGVCDEAGGHVLLYVDGVLNGSTTITSAGLKSLTSPLSIGSRLASSTSTWYTNQFSGSIDDVSIYGTALSASQVQAHYYAAGIAPVITMNPTNTSVNDGATAFFYAAASGTPPLALQWYDQSTGTPVRISGQTNATLVISNVSFATDNNRDFVLVATNLYGQATSLDAVLTVVGGAPQITGDIQPLLQTVKEGTPITFAVTATGTVPLHYQWTKDGAPIAGATVSSYSFSAVVGTNTYAVTVNNSFPPPANSSTATVIGLAVPKLDPATFGYRMKIQFTGYDRGEALANFPALVKLSPSLPGFSYSQFSLANGGDLRFTDSGGIGMLPFEIDQWADTNGVSSVWVQVPTLSSTNDFIYAYWGNATPTNGIPSTNVWVPEYTVVYHLKESGFPFADSTSQYTAASGSVTAPASAAGTVGLGTSWNGSDFLDAGTATINDLSTISAWVAIPGGTANIQTVWANQHGGYGAPGFALFVNTYQQSDGIVDFATGTGTGGNEARSPAGTFGFDQWHLLSAVVDRTAGTVQFYLDGSSVGAGNGVAFPGFTNVADLWLGMFTDNNFGFHGLMDEARIAANTNSANWVWADYMTVAANSSFESYSAITSQRTLSYQVSGGNLILSWPSGTLQAAPTVNGTYTNIVGAPNPYTTPLSGPQRYFRVKVQ